MPLTPPEKRILKFIAFAIVIAICFLVGMIIIKVLFATPTHLDGYQVCLSAPNSLGCDACLDFKNSGPPGDRNLDNTCGKCEDEYDRAAKSGNYVYSPECVEPSPTPTEEVLLGSGNPSEKQAFHGIKRFEKSGKGPAEFEFEAGGIAYVTSIYAYGNKNEALPTRVNFLSSETRNAFEAVDVIVTNDTGSDFGPSTDQRAGRMSGTYVVTVDTSEDVTWKIEMFEVSR